ncbi:hypothetical protein CW706_04085 [Candidatus Bathyarchaeota archaeon]|nr:MAG: hypothetical protein CW706_04085 [Candidatus Bathyarchaeota archaeon]
MLSSAGMYESECAVARFLSFLVMLALCFLECLRFRYFYKTKFCAILKASSITFFIQLLPLLLFRSFLGKYFHESRGIFVCED